MRDCDSNVSAELEVVYEEKDLGVWRSADLKPSLHCYKAAAKASQALGLVRRAFKTNSVDMFTFSL